MKTPANRPHVRTRPDLPVLLGLSLLAAACSSDPQPNAQDAPAASEQVAAPQDCLLLVWSEQDSPDIAFDRANDTVSGGAISCATGSSPSQFRDALSAIKAAARSGDRAGLLR